MGRTYRREMDDLHARLSDLPEELKVLVLSKIEHVETGQILGLSSDVWEALSLLRALRRTFYFEGASSKFADHLVCLLDDDHVRLLEKERALELLTGDERNRLCEYACGRNFEVLKWAHNELDLPWAPYPPGRVSDDVVVLRVIRETWSALKGRWPEGKGHVEWEGVTMVDGRVVELVLHGLGLCAVPAEIWRLSALRKLNLYSNQLTSVPAEIGQLTSLQWLNLYSNQLTSVPTEIGQLTSLQWLNLRGNRLMSVPAGIGQLASLVRLALSGNRLTSVPAEIGQLTSLTHLDLGCNQLRSVPAEIGQLTSLEELRLTDNRMTSVPAAIRELRAAGCNVTWMTA